MAPRGPRGIKPDEDHVVARWRTIVTPYGMVIFYFLIGTILTFGPSYWFGPTWSYFQFLPHGGFGFGVACYLLCVTLIYAIWRKSKRLASLVFLCGGLAFYIAGFLVGAQGMAGKSGLMEAPFMMYCGIDMLIESVAMRR